MEIIAPSTNHNISYIEAYVHHDKSIGVLIEFCDLDDFTTNTEVFRRLSKQLAQHIAFHCPEGDSNEQRMTSFLNHKYLFNEDLCVKQVIRNHEKALGMKIYITKIARFGR